MPFSHSVIGVQDKQWAFLCMSMVSLADGINFGSKNFRENKKIQDCCIAEKLYGENDQKSYVEKNEKKGERRKVQMQQSKRKALQKYFIDIHQIL